MHHHIGAKLQWTLQGGRTEAVVHRQQRPRLVRNRSHPRDVDHFGERVGGRLDEEQLGTRPDRFAIGVQVGRRNEAGLYAELRQDVAKELLSSAEQTSRRHNMVARLQHRHRQRQDGRHARGGGHTGFGALQCGQPRLHRAHRRIGEARVHITLLRTRKPRRGLGRTVEHEA